MKYFYPIAHRTFFITAILLIHFSTAGFGQSASISLSKSNLPDFKGVYTNHFSDVQFYYVTAQGLGTNLVITAGEPFKISLDCFTGFSSTVTIPTASGQVASTRVYVRLFPEVTGNLQAQITHTGDGAPSKSLSVSGSGTNNLVPQNYYSSATGTGSQLKTQLYQIISGHQAQSYGWQHYPSTDATFDGKVWDIYSDTPCQEPPYVFTFGVDQDSGSGGSQEGQFYNREHSFPRSWFNDANPMNTDLYHLYPTDKLVNNKRGSFPYGVVGNASWTSQNGSKVGSNTAGNYQATVFEPRDDYKGDLARSYFYMITRYENLIESWSTAMLDNNKYPGFEPWVISMLMQWHGQDPVSQKEILRNNAIFGIQGNRNPFIDHPEFVETIWGDPTVSAPTLPNDPTVIFYPNPATDHISFESLYEVYQLKAFSVTGKLVIDQGPTNNGTQVSLKELTPGVYFLTLYTQHGIFRKKIIKH